MYSTPRPALHTWVSLCKTLSPPVEGHKPDHGWDSYHDDYKLFQSGTLKNVLPPNLLKADDKVAPCDAKTAPPLLALAIGCKGNDTAEMIYRNMMDVASHRGQ